ncbi:MAG: AAA family ATPase [Oscillospiraceae bacterium]|nr:AAA family ATPase [Oscillospiraceae bacterium]
MRLDNHNKIMVIGNNGSGKSYLSKRLAAITGLPLVHLDVAYWLPDLTKRPEDDWRQMHGKLIAEEKWIIDGNYMQADALILRWAAADLVIFLDVNRVVCLFSAVKRNFHSREDGPRDFQETWDRRFLDMCVMIWHFTRDRRDIYLAPREKNSDTAFFTIKGRKNMHKLLRAWKEECGIE